jgi:hypothetical protein
MNLHGREEEPMQDLQNLSTYETGIETMRKVRPNFLIGALIGAGLALLLAPAAGRDTRRRLRSTAKQFGSNAKNAIGRTRESFQGVREDARSAMQHGREEYRRSRERRGQSDWSPASPTA